MDLSEYNNEKIGIALSGGIDSTVAAFLLKNANAQVKGYFMNHINNAEALANAKKSAQQLGISLEIIDVRKEFYDEIIKYFIEEYEDGRTPNPCVICNVKIKFGLLMAQVLKENKWFATGHYARKVKVNGNWTIARAVDKSKDQSYALSMLSQEQIKRSVLPLGTLKKTEVKKIAEQNNLKITQQKESVDLCFTNSRTEFFKKNTQNRQGIIRDVSANIIGKHNGVQFFAIGQRKRLGIDNVGPNYVKQINSEKNEITVSKFDDLYKKIFFVAGVNYLIPYRKNVNVIVRNKMEPLECQIFRQDDNTLKVIMKNEVWAPAPGQLAVFYDKDLVVCAGWIT